jgi:hypothetical protein
MKGEFAQNTHSNKENNIHFIQLGRNSQKFNENEQVDGSKHPFHLNQNK